ncbi:2Fe-2S iron-sulfur cluster-binding protein [Polaromonas sp. LjRoot131]|uniref:2Fe-2S iron-sulfur cluster-binding protein n=1 Tax=Polaromonas sp. LjRoot131 TaxID=3342262 RepID=UPI003ED08408
MSPISNNAGASPWHPGELALQESAGVVKQMDGPGRLWVRKFLLDQHRTFYPLLHFVVLGCVDANGDAWATLLAGEPGFASSPDPKNLNIATLRDPSDPADSAMEDGDAVGLLGIDLMTRRRNRLNGDIRRANDHGFDIEVVQSYGNCPRYIQNRSFMFTRAPYKRSPFPAEESSGLDDQAREMIASADTFYVASYLDLPDGTREVDASHRGGKPGFVRIESDGKLTIPDFSGNLFFNTLGNFLQNPKAGLVFVDPQTGNMLQMTGEAEVILDSPEIAAFEGAERLWTFTPRRIIHRPQGLPLRWQMEPDGWSQNLQMTGTWEDARQRLAVMKLAQKWRPFRVTNVVQESAPVRSLYLEPDDGLALAPWNAGQHLPVRIQRADGSVLTRSYTLTTAPADGLYRISVKRDGEASALLHELRVGDRIETRAPAGSFTIDAALRRPVVLLGAGIGITPMLAMLLHLAHEGRRTRHLRPIWLFQAARTYADQAFGREIKSLVDSSGGKIHWIRSLSKPGTAVIGQDYEVEGRITMDLLKAVLPFDDYDFYLCGPSQFMQDTYDGLRDLSVRDERIHAESFGPSSLRRMSNAGGSVPELLPATESVKIIFTKSAKEGRWSPGDKSLLEVAEARGLSPPFGCRGGSCGECKCRVTEGAVTYLVPPLFPIGDGEALVCCAVPSTESKGVLHLDI